MRHRCGASSARARSSTCSARSPNPAGARAGVFGVYAPEVARTVADALAVLDSRRAFVVHGAHGVDELSPAGPNLVFEVVDGAVRERIVDPLELGIERCDPAELAGGSPEDNARTAREVFAGRRGAKRDAVVLNAAGAIAAGGHAHDLRGGYRGRRGGDRQRPRGGTAGGARRVLATIRLMGRFEDALRRPGLTAIAEVKRRSPSAGDLRPDADPAALAAAYERAGAAAASILVDERFGGTWDDLRAARASASLPLLAKGFFSTEEDLRTAREAGADAALLLLRDLDDATARRLLDVATELGLETLVEAHDAEELERAVALGAPVIGVNARDLATFDIDRAAQLRLVAQALLAIASSSRRAGSSRARRVPRPSSPAPTRSSSARRSCARRTRPRSSPSSSRGRSSRSAG